MRGSHFHFSRHHLNNPLRSHIPIQRTHTRYSVCVQAAKTKFSSFDDMVKQYDVALVDFYAIWCGPCHMMSQTMSEASTSMKNVKCIKIDTEKNPNIANAFSVAALPTLVLFKHGKPIARQEGVLTVSQLQQWVESSLAKAN